jgi:concanavalin A-like lectin/glucanase superfamily protein
MRRNSFGGFGIASCLKITVLPGSTGRVVLGTAFLLLAAGACSAQSAYDQVVLTDGPVGFWDISAAGTDEPDLTGNGNDGTYINGLPRIVVMPNGDVAADFNGSNQYLNVPSDPGGAFSIPTTGTLTWEAWIRPDVLDFPNENKGYVSYLGKCDSYNPTCEWEARMYGLSTDRPNRLSAYAFNPSAGLGSGAFWQPVSNLFQPSEWLHVVGEYTILSQPDVCQNASMYPGSIDIWVNGVEWNQSTHGQTGCMSQYNVIPQANTSALNIGTMARDSWFQGAIAKVAIYNYPLTQDQITAHYTAMTGLTPTGSCGSTCTF